MVSRGTHREAAGVPWHPPSGASSVSVSVFHAARNRQTQVHRATACFPVDQPPEGKHWIHEIKHDGYLSQVVIERGKARVFSRNGHDWSDRYPGIVRAAAKLGCKSAIIDG